MAGKYDGSIRINTKIDSAQAVKNLDSLKQRFARQNEAVEKQRVAVERLRSQYEKMASGQMQPKSFQAMEKELQKVSAEAEKLDERLKSLSTTAAQERYMTGAVSPGTQSEIDRVSELLAQADARADRLKADMEVIRLDPTASAEAQKLAQDLGLAQSKLSRLESEAADTGVKIARATEQANESVRRLGNYAETTRQSLRSASTSAKGFDRVGRSVARLGTRMRRLIASALLFSAVTRLFTNLREYMGNALKTSDEFTDAVGRLKGALATAFQPVFEAVLPALTSFINTLATVISYIAQFIALLFGTTVSASSKAAESLYNQANAYGAAGGAASKAAKQLAAFDEINKLSDTSGGGGGGGGIEATFEQSGERELPGWMQKTVDWFRDIAGRIDVKKIEDLRDAWQSFKRSLSELVNSEGFKTLVGWLTNVGISIADMSLGTLEGLLTLLEGIVNLDFEKADQGLGKMFASIFGNGSRSYVEAFEQLLGLDGLTEWFDGVMETFKSEGFVGGFKEVASEWLAGMLIGFQQGWPRLESWWQNTALFGWWTNTVKPWFASGKWKTLISDGLILGFKSAWQLFTDWWKNTAVFRWWNDSVKPAFSKEKWEGILSGIPKAFTAVFRSAMNAAISAFELGINNMISRVNNLIATINGVISLVGGLFGGTDFQIPNIPSVKLPRLAQGTVVNPGHEFAAILGDNQREQEIVSPLSTMKQAFKEALAESGARGGTAVLEIDGRRFGRVVYPYVQAEGGRIGTKLVTGGV